MSFEKHKIPCMNIEETGATMSLENAVNMISLEKQLEAQSKFWAEKEKELKEVSEYNDERKSKVENLSSNVRRMNILHLLWDSKVPEKKKNFYYFFNLTPSNRTEILDEIMKYKKFYDELSNAIRKIKNLEVQNDDEEDYPHGEIIQALNKDLSEMHKVAKYELHATDSKTIYKLHRSFIEKHELLEDMIAKVEGVVLKEKIMKAKCDLENCTQRINELGNLLKDSAEKSNQLYATAGEAILNANELPEQHDDLVKDNQVLEEVQEVLQQKKKAMRTEVEELLQLNKEIEKENEILQEKNQKMENVHVTLQQNMQKLHEELKNIRKHNLKLEEEQELLRQKIAKMPEEKEKVLQKCREMMLEKEKLLQDNQKLKEEQQNIQQQNEKITEELNMKLNTVERKTIDSSQ